MEREAVFAFFCSLKRLTCPLRWGENFDWDAAAHPSSGMQLQTPLAVAEPRCTGGALPVGLRSGVGIPQLTRDLGPGVQHRGALLRQAVPAHGDLRESQSRWWWGLGKRSSPAILSLLSPPCFEPVLPSFLWTSRWAPHIPHCFQVFKRDYDKQT